MMRRYGVSPILAAIVAAGTGLMILQTLPGDTIRDMRPTPACVTEDSPGPCVWHADTQGNGVGRSFYRDRQGRIHPL